MLRIFFLFGVCTFYVVSRNEKFTRILCYLIIAICFFFGIKIVTKRVNQRVNQWFKMLGSMRRSSVLRDDAYVIFPQNEIQ